MIGLRWYLARAKDGYLRESASYSRDQRDAHRDRRGRPHRRGARPRPTSGSAAIDDDIAESYAAERYTLYLRTVFFPSMEIAYLIPTVLHAAPRRLPLHAGPGVARRGDRGDALRADADRPGRPDRRRSSTSCRWVRPRWPGCSASRRCPTTARSPAPGPTARSSTPTDVRFSYVEGRDVLHGVDLDVGVGERIAMVGPSGAGKSTLGRLLAGIHPPRTGVGHRRRRRAGGAAARRPARPRRAGDAGAPRLRRHPAREPRPGRASGRQRRRHPRRARRRRRPRLGGRAARRAWTPRSARAAGR